MIAPQASWPTLLLIGGVWAPIFALLTTEWEINPQYSYGWGVPLLGLYLFTRRWPAGAPQPSPAKWLTGAIIGAAFLCLPLRLVYESNPDWRLINWSAGLIAVAVTGLVLWKVGGPPWVKHYAVPVLFLLTAVPWPSFLETRLVNSLLGVVTSATTETLHWLGIGAVQHGNVIRLASGQEVGVNEACSGVRSFQSTLMVALFVGELFRLKWSRRIGLALGGAAYAVVLNILRTSSLAWVTARKGTAVQAEWHDPAGYALFGVAVLGVWLAGWWMSPPKPAPEDKAAAPTAVPCWLPKGLAFALCGWLVATEVLNEFWYRAHESDRHVELAWSIRWPAATEGFPFKGVPEEVRVILRSNQSEQGVWQRADGSRWTMFFNKWKASRVSSLMARVHRPDICLPSAGFKQVEERPTEIIQVGDLEMPFRSYVFDNQGKPWHVFFCVMEDRPEPAFSVGVNKLLDAEASRSQRLRAVLHGHRNLGQQVFEVAMVGYRTLEQARRAFEAELPRLINLSREKS